MKKISFLVLIAVIGLVLYSCNKSDSNSTVALRDYKEQYDKDIDSIEKFMNTHSMSVDADYKVSFADVTAGASNSIKAAYNPGFRSIEEDGITYKLYYISLNSGTEKNPTPTDSVYVSYKGFDLDNVVFDSSQSPVWFKLDNLVTGWAHIMPAFKSGIYTESGSNVNFSNFGSGVMFLPSGLAYFNQAAGTLDQYEPTIFSFKLYEVRYRDQDGDKILSKDEVPFSEVGNYFYNPKDYDSNSDGVPNYYDIDDDGDHVKTIDEIRFGDTTSKVYYPFNGAVTDNPLTTIDETRGIPSCSNDYTTSNRLRKHLDPNCQ